MANQIREFCHDLDSIVMIKIYACSTLLTTLTLNIFSILDNDVGYIETSNDVTLNVSCFMLHFVHIFIACLLQMRAESLSLLGRSLLRKFKVISRGY